jgi:CcmD family protein
MLPLLITALLVWAGVFFFVFRVDQRTRELERRLDDRLRGAGSGGAREGDML